MKDSSERAHGEDDRRDTSSSSRRRPGVRVRPLWMRRLKPSVEWEIIKALRAGESVRSLAEKYKAPVSHINKLKKGQDTSFYRDEE